MTRAELKTRAKAQIKGKIGILFVMNLVVGIISGIPLAGIILSPGLGLSMSMAYLGLTVDTLSASSICISAVSARM